MKKEIKEIIPGVGLGTLKFGMTRDDVKKLVGKPDEVENLPGFEEEVNDELESWHYDEHEFSLVFDDNGYFHQTLWSKFHKYKWDRYQQSEILSAEINMTSYDWNEMTINRPILYRGEIYSLIELSGFNPVTQIAQIKMIKKL